VSPRRRRSAPALRSSDTLATDRLTLHHRLEQLRGTLAALEEDVESLLLALDTAALSSTSPPPATPSSPLDSKEAGEYLSLRELARRIPYAEQTIRNLMSRGVFRVGEHYLKPRSRIMFRWSRVQEWLQEQPVAR